MKNAHLKLWTVLSIVSLALGGQIPPRAQAPGEPETISQSSDLVTPLANAPAAAKVVLQKIKNGGAKVSLSGQGADQLYRLEFSSNLQDWDTLKDWTFRSNAKPDPLEWSDADSKSAIKFYRVRPVIERLWGAVALDRPLIGATITILDAQGNKLLEQANATSETGVFDLGLKVPPKSLKVVATGGNVRGEPFTGSVVAEVSDFDGRGFVVANPVSTLIAAYRAKHPELNLGTATSKVNEFLRAPADVDPVRMVNLDNTQYFSPNAFMFEASDAGGLNAFADKLVADWDSGKTQPFLMLQKGVVGLIGDFLMWGFKQIASGAVGAVGGKGGNFLMSLIFGSDDTGAKLDEIKNEIGKINNKLNQIEAKVDEVIRGVNEVNQTLQVVQWDTAIAPIIPSISTIKGTFDTLQNLAQSASANPTNYVRHAEQLCDINGPILSPANGVLHAIEEMDENIRGIFNKTSLLRLHADRVQSRLKYDNRAQIYEPMESFFAALLGIQLKGVNLVVEAYVGRGEPEMATAYLAGFYKDKLIPQVQLFQTTVEQVVLSQLDSRWAEFLPDAPSVMLAPAYRFPDQIQNGYQISAQTGQLVGTNSVTILTAAIGIVGAPSDAWLNGSLGFNNWTTMSSVEVPAVAATTISADGGSLSIVRFLLKSVASGTYQVKSPSYSPIYISEKLEINAADTNKLYGTICLPQWAPQPSKFGESATGPKYKITSAYFDRVLEFAGRSTVDGARVQQWEKTGFDNQKWKNEDTAGMSGRNRVFRNKFSGQVLTIPGAAREEGVHLRQGGWVNVPHQKWRIHEGWTDFQIAPEHALDMRAEVQGSETKMTGAFVIQKRYMTTTEYSWWKAEAADSGYEYLRNTGSGKYLEVAGPTKEVEAHLQLVPSNNESNQKWMFVYRGGGYYALVNVYGEMVADLWAGSSADGAEIRSNTWQNNNNQLWRIDALGDGSYRIISNGVGKAVTVDGGFAQDGAKALSYHWYDNYNQKWLLTPTN